MEQIDLREIPNFYDMENSVKADGKLDLSALCSFLTEKVAADPSVDRRGVWRTRSDCSASARCVETAKVASEGRTERQC